MGGNKSKPKPPPGTDGYRYVHFREYLRDWRLEELPPGFPVTLHGLIDNPECNGRATVVSFDSSKGEYSVKIPVEDDSLLHTIYIDPPEDRVESVPNQAIFVRVLEAKPDRQLLELLKAHCSVTTGQNTETTGWPRVDRPFFGSRKMHSLYMISEGEKFAHTLEPELIDLITSRCDVNAQDEYGQTALHIALDALPCSAVGCAANLLVEHGGDLALPNTFGATPIALAYNTFSQLQPVDEDSRRAFLLRYEANAIGMRYVWSKYRSLCEQARAEPNDNKQDCIARMISLPVHIFQYVLVRAFPLLPSRVATFKEIRERQAWERANCEFASMCDDY